MRNLLPYILLFLKMLHSVVLKRTLNIFIRLENSSHNSYGRKYEEMV